MRVVILGCAPRSFEHPEDERFWAKVDRTGGPDACWLWRASVDSHGYGHIKIDRRLWLAHRRAWQVTNGLIPDGKCILHSCDSRYPVGSIENRRCCNPRHLYPGTKRDNSDDMIANGRALHYSGEDHGRAKITSSDAIAIRDAAQQGAPQREIARRYGLGKTTVGHIIARHTWRFA